MKTAGLVLAAALPLTLPAVAHAQAELVVDGNFTAGNTNNPGFSTDYTPAPGNGTSNPPDYAVITNPTTAFPGINFDSYGDHTNGTGLMLYADGASNPASRVWFETLNLAANTTYTVSFWGANADLDNPGSPATLQFFSGAMQVGTDLDLPSGSPGMWTQMTGTLNSGAGGSVVVSIDDSNTSAPDNDFTIDDISVRSVSSGAAAPEPQSVVLLGGFVFAAFPVAKLRQVRRRRLGSVVA